VLLIITNYTLATTRQQLSMQQAEHLTGIAYADVGRVYARLLERVMADGAHPALAAAVAAGAFGDTDAVGPQEDFDYGLEFILDGIGALAERHAARQDSTSRR
jgi:hypothetical protein